MSSFVLIFFFISTVIIFKGKTILSENRPMLGKDGQDTKIVSNRLLMEVSGRGVSRTTELRQARKSMALFMSEVAPSRVSHAKEGCGAGGEGSDESAEAAL